MKKNHFKVFCTFLIMTLLMAGCDNNLELVLPQGPKGDKGDKGDPGMSAFEMWLVVNGKDANTPIEDFFNSLRGSDGEAGAVPIIGSNGNWMIDGVDTGVPASGNDGKDGITPHIGENGNWFIEDEDTGIPARGEQGEKGVDGKSAYELWKEAVDSGEMTNKDGSDYEGGNSWEDFLKWLQGGDVSILHQYWIGLPGNDGKSMEEFINELFDCHCDGITVSMAYTDDCIMQNPDGTLKESYHAQLRVGGPGGTQLRVTGVGVDLSDIIADDHATVVFDIPRGNESIQIQIACTQSGNTVIKHAVVPALQLIRMNTVPVVVQVQGEQKDLISFSFTIAPAQLFVDETIVYDAGEIITGSGWTVSDQGRTFSRTYIRGATEQHPTLRAINQKGVCTTIEDAFSIPSLEPVNYGEIDLTIMDDCFLTLTLEGTEGMTVTAMNASNHSNFVSLVEYASGRYITSEIPRRYEAYTILIRAEKEGLGTVEKTINVEGSFLVAEKNPLSITLVPGEENELGHALVKRRFTNNLDEPIAVRVTRSNNSTVNALQHPKSPLIPFTGIIEANSFVDVEFYRDYTVTLASGNYELTFVTRNICGLEKTYTLKVENQQGYRHAFSLPEGWGDGSGNPNDPITFEVSIFDAIPHSFVEFQLFNGTAYNGVSRRKLDENGNLTWSVTMTRSQLQTALSNVQGFFYFFADSAYITKYNIGADKEEIIFSFN